MKNLNLEIVFKNGSVLKCAKGNEEKLRGISANNVSMNKSKVEDTELETLFEKLGYRVDWDFSKKLGESWIEVLDPKTNRIVLQVSKGVSEEDFLREFFLETEDPLPFFIGYEESEDGEIFKNKLKEYSILRNA